ncbi:hypothetical protein NUM_05870 [Actinocatenispora comari]|uniref:Uncharacterized protein n=1 Tax=Actinocatenispora comari TaxID=2807577 RepID=A0A8J4A916_9ACTN|nr:hypothetical protein NUM_05870 [Actinocatenispora comari]
MALRGQPRHCPVQHIGHHSCIESDTQQDDVDGGDRDGVPDRLDGYSIADQTRGRRALPIYVRLEGRPGLQAPVGAFSVSGWRFRHAVLLSFAATPPNRTWRRFDQKRRASWLRRWSSELDIGPSRLRPDASRLQVRPDRTTSGLGGLSNGIPPPEQAG